MTQLAIHAAKEICGGTEEDSQWNGKIDNGMQRGRIRYERDKGTFRD